MYQLSILYIRNVFSAGQNLFNLERESQNVEKAAVLAVPTSQNSPAPLKLKSF